MLIKTVYVSVYIDKCILWKHAAHGSRAVDQLDARVIGEGGSSPSYPQEVGSLLYLLEHIDK